MRCYVEKADGSFVEEDREPECGVDFCDSCGDCLHCYGGDPCLERENEEHHWVKPYNKKDEEEEV
jgi:hypothetical protein